MKFKQYILFTFSISLLGTMHEVFLTIHYHNLATLKIFPRGIISRYKVYQNECQGVIQLIRKQVQ